MRSPPTPVPYSRQQRQRAKRMGRRESWAFHSARCPNRDSAAKDPSGGGYCHAPLGSLRPMVSSTNLHFADGAFVVQFAGLRAERGADSLRADLHDAVIRPAPPPPWRNPAPRCATWASRNKCLCPRCRRPPPRACANVGHGGDDAVDIFAVEQFLVAAGGGQTRVVGNFLGEGMTAILKVGCADALHARKARGRCPGGPTPACRFR